MFPAPLVEMPEIRPEDFEYFQELILRVAGIRLGGGKRELVQGRLRLRVEALKLPGFTAYREYLETLPSGAPEWQKFINSLTTNKTDWFREPGHFELLEEQARAHRAASAGEPFAVWSAACSTGEEPYSISMVLGEALGVGNYEVLATDLDTDVLGVARNGVYPASRGLQVPELYRQRAFARGTGELAEWISIRKTLRTGMAFERLNLADSSYPWENRFHIVFCRNVFIYFPKDVIERIVNNLYRAARPGGLLLIGHSESLHGVRTDWKYLRPSVFVKAKD